MNERSWSWLSEPLALDFANTMHWHGTDDVDHLDTPDGVRDWLAHEPHPLPGLDVFDDAAHRELLALRDSSRRTFRALSAGDPFPADDLDTINQAARRHPTVRSLDPVTLDGVIEPAAPGTNALIGFLATTVIGLLAEREEVARLAFCTAPNCGGLFRQSRPNQKWCHPDCGARARADRQYRRRKESPGTQQP